MKHRVVADFGRGAEALVPRRDDAAVFVHRNFQVRLNTVLRVDGARRVPYFSTVRTQFQSVDAWSEQEGVVSDIVIVVRFSAERIVVGLAEIRILTEHECAASFRVHVVLNDERSERLNVCVERQSIRVLVRLLGPARTRFPIGRTRAE